MNNILKLSGIIRSEKRKQAFGDLKFSKDCFVDSERIDKLIRELVYLKNYWQENQNIINVCLIAVKYVDIISKSKRIKSFIYEGDNVVGARYVLYNNEKVHCIVYRTSLDEIKNTIEKLTILKQIVDEKFDGHMSNIELTKSKTMNLEFAKSKFIRLCVDVSNIYEISLPIFDVNVEENNIVNFYDVGINVSLLLEKIGLDTSRIILSLDKSTAVLNKEQLETILSKTPYLISMSCSNVATYYNEEDINIEEKEMFILPPENQPTIGVIDTLFNEKVYFKDWVEYHEDINKDIPFDRIASEDHGTMISSIIVDGPNLNPDLDDGCGNFKVRHFGIATNDKNDAFIIMEKIKKIISENRDIHVWNLSLGSEKEINENFISPEAAILDQLQIDYDVIFVISGTNDNRISLHPIGEKRIGSPADSINSLVINSVNKKKEPASYTRKGEVLSFYIKPDISYYGGDDGEKINAYCPFGVKKVSGTSFAAPWVARKLSYLIDILGLNKEVAKALLIDATIGWDGTKSIANSQLLGYGVLPIHINDIIRTKSNEIKFIITSFADNYNTYAYNIPVPLDSNGKFPFKAKVTLCYFSKCSRNQGVDYTNTELDVHFGRINSDGKIKTIDNNYQDEAGSYVTEKESRINYRKWDNVKCISERITTNKNGIKKYSSNMWGFSIKTKERENPYDKTPIKFGLIVTLYEIKQENRIEEFIKNCFASGWIVEEIDIQNRLDIYNFAQLEINFDE